MKPSVIREMTTDELRDKLVDEVDQLNKLKVNHSVSSLENPLVIKHKRKIIARLNTEITKRVSFETK